MAVMLKIMLEGLDGENDDADRAAGAIRPLESDKTKTQRWNRGDVSGSACHAGAPQEEGR